MTVKHKTRGGSCRKLRGGNPFQFNSGAPYSGAGSSGMGPNIASLGASGGRRRGSRTRRGGRRSGKTTGGSILSTASMPFGLLGLQSWFKGAFKSKKD